MKRKKDNFYKKKKVLKTGLEGLDDDIRTHHEEYHRQDERKAIEEGLEELEELEHN
jgi:hypothetical protein